MTEAVSFVNNFWGENDGGLRVIQQKIQSSSKTLSELLEFFHERIIIEKEYNKKLSKLTDNFRLGSEETGTLKVSLDKLLIEENVMIQYQNKFIKTVNLQNYEKLQSFQTIYNKKIGKLEGHMTKLSNRRNDGLKSFETYKDRYKEECRQIKSLRFQCQGTWGKELERLQQKLNKLLNGINHSRQQYVKSCKMLQELQEIYMRDWSAILRDFYQLEAERIQICKVNCFSYCNNIATLCVENDQSADNARTLFAKVSPNEDLHTFSSHYGTGNKIYTAPEFIEFMDGLEDRPSNESFTFANFETSEYLVRSQSMHIKSDVSEYGVTTTSPKAKPITPAASPTSSKYHSRISPPANKTPQPRMENNVSPIQNKANSNVNANGIHLPPGSTTLQPVSLPPPISSNATYIQRAMNPGTDAFIPSDPFLTVKTPSPSRKAEHTSNKTLSNYSTGSGSNSGSNTASNDVFSIGKGDLKVNAHNDVFRTSGTSSNYSNPTSNYASSNYSAYSSNSHERNWATPRKKEIQQVKKVQDRINLNLKELPLQPTPSKFSQLQYYSRKSISAPPKNVPIQKDFSIDYIAKALEDLNSGGNGDINQYRRSVRRARQLEQAEQDEFDRTEQLSPAKSLPACVMPAADFVDDRNEVATRYESINFNSPEGVRSDGSVKRRPKSMFESSMNIGNDNILAQSRAQDEPFLTPSKHSRPTRSLLKTPSKSYTNLHSFIQDSPIKPQKNDSGFTPSGKPYVGKVKAMYTYKPQHHGELYFKKNWYMYVLHKQEDNWFVCELASEPGVGAIGLVPGNYVKDDSSF